METIQKPLRDLQVNMGKLRDYEQIRCPYCNERLRAYLFTPHWKEPHYETSECPRHGAHWMRPELVRVLRVKRKDWIGIGRGLN